MCMNRYVTVKSNKYGLALYLDPNISFDVLCQEIERTFTGTEDFFANSRIAVSFEGRILTKDQELQLIEIISKRAQIEIVCIIDHDEKRERMYKRVVEDTLDLRKDLPVKDGLFCRGTLHKNQILESEKSIVVLGDVERGATVAAKGNIIVLGRLEGKAYAGMGGIKNSFILSLSMQPQKLRIGNVKVRTDNSLQNEIMSITPKIAIAVGDQLHIIPFANV